MKKSILIITMFLTCSGAYAENAYEGEESIRTGRYTLIANRPEESQKNPLKVIVSTNIPNSIKTIGATVDFLLARSGYVLADEKLLSEEVNYLLALPIPQVHRKLGPMTLDRALETLGGDGYSLVVDPIHRIVGYELTSILGREMK